MPQFAHTVESQVAPEAVWAAYTDVTTWPSWNPGMVSMVLDSSFTQGAKGTVTTAGAPPAAFTLTRVDEKEGFTIEVDLGGGLLSRSTCDVSALAGGGSQILHTITLEGPGSEDMAGINEKHMRSGLESGLAQLTALASER